ncbi:NAD(P)-binding domain-containing protein [Streptomyces canus]|uniref:NADPH-dependent F420 reductase n=1 Tax=Streptomyces canus TaxID=58343 RepID=UPI0033EFC7AB
MIIRRWRQTVNSAAAAGAAPAGDIVVLAVPYGSAAAVVSEYGDALRGKVIIDITNPVNADFTGFVTLERSSGAQEIAKAAPAGAHVVKAFNTLYSHVLAAGPAEGRPLDVFIAGDDTQEKTRVSAFIEMLGLVAHSIKHTNFFLGVSISSWAHSHHYFSRHVTPVGPTAREEQPFHSSSQGQQHARFRH